MHPPPCRSLLAAALLAGCAHAPAAQDASRPCRASSTASTRIEGTVRDTTGAPIQFAHVRVVGTGLQAVADSTGHYALPAVPLGPVVLRAQWVGYRTRDLATCLEPEESPVVFVDFALTPKLEVTS